MKRTIIGLIALAFASRIHAETIFTEDFETDGQGTRYTATQPFNDGSSDHWNRTDGSDIANVSGAYSSYSNTYFWAAEDTDDDGGNGDDSQTITFNAVNVSAYTNLMFYGLFGAGNENGPGSSAYDAADYIRVQYDADSGGWTDLMWFSYEDQGDAYNEPLAYDHDQDGDGEGTRLGTSLQQFSTNLPDASSIQLRIMVYMDAGSEEIAFDSIRITGELSSGNQPPSLSAIGNKSVVVSNNLQFTVTASDVIDGNDITLYAGNLPAGAVFTTVTNAAGATNTFTWNTASPVGVYTTTFYAADIHGTDSEDVVIAVMAPSALIISEIADPADDYKARFVELYNAGAYEIDFSNETWYVCRQSGGGATWYDTLLTGKVAAGSTYILANYTNEFFAHYGVWANIKLNGSTAGNGDDGTFLYKDGDHTAGVLVDAYGEVDVDGTGTAWEYEDAFAQRVGSVTQPRVTWTQTEWIILSADTTNVTPFVHPPSNYPPVINSIGDQSVMVSNDLQFSVTAQDRVDGDAVSLTVSNLPAGAVWGATNGNGTVWWTNAAPEGEYTNVQFYATDEDGFDVEIITITVTGPNYPYIDQLLNRTVYLGENLRFDVTAHDDDGEDVTLYASNLPGTATFGSVTNAGSVTNTFTWNSVGPIGVYTAAFYAASSDGTDFDPVTITVLAGIGSDDDDLVTYVFETNGVFTPYPRHVGYHILPSVFTNNPDNEYTDYNGNPGRAIADSGWLTNNTQYFQFSLTIEDGYTASITGLTFHCRSSSTGPTNWAFRYSGDGYAIDLAAGASDTNWISIQEPLSLNGQTGTLTFRLYADNAPSTFGTWRVDNVGILTMLDMDGDRIRDAWEYRNFTNLNVASDLTDFDNDGFRDLYEYQGNTMPTNIDSFLGMNTASSLNFTNLVIRWQSSDGVEYTLLRGTNLNMADYIVVESNITANPPENVFTDDVPATVDRWFYRIQLDQ